MDAIIRFFESLQTMITWREALIAIGFSLVCSIIVYLMYQIFYGSRNVGAGVHRIFIIGGPAITVLFVAIQVSIPLGLGLLGALAFVRFRTPVKDPAEIGFLLLLVASSICAATSNFLLAGVLFIVVFVALGVQWLAQNRISGFGQGHLMLAVERSAFPGLEGSLDSFLKENLRGVRLETVSATEDRVTLHYRYRSQRDFDWAAFSIALDRLAEPSKVELFIG
jgi:hypothetical protein